MDRIEEENLHTIFSQVVRLHFLRVHSYLDKVGLYPGQAPLLFQLKKRDGQSQSELAKKLSVTPATVTVMIKRMEKNGLIRRENDIVDKRVSRIFINKKGLEICSELHNIHIQIENECIFNFSEKDIVLLRSLLKQIRDNLKKACYDNNIKYYCCDKNKE